MGDLVRGEEFAGHRVEGIAGRGGMGVVYRARHLTLDRVVALKLIASERAQEPAFRERFLHECRVAAELDNPHVLPIYDAGEHDGALYLTMRYVDGDDLRSLIAREHALAPASAASIVAQVAEALDAAHARGLVHRDVKPANVLLGSGDHAWLADFGLTKRVTAPDGVTDSGSWVGTLDYVAPEQIRGEVVDGRADVYALGCVLFQALTGFLPFPREGQQAKLWAHLSEPPPSLRELVPALDARLDAVVARALAKLPDERFATAGGLGRAALAAAGVGGVGGERSRHSERSDLHRTLAMEAVARPTAGEASAALVTPGVPGNAPRRREPQPAGAGEAVNRRRLLAAVALALAAAALTALGLSSGGSDHGARVIARVPVDETPNTVAVTPGAVWGAGFGFQTIAHIDSATNTAGVGAGVGPAITQLAPGFGALWATRSRDPAVVEIDPRSGRVLATIAIPLAAGRPVTIVAGAGAMWVGTYGATGNRLLRIDPERRRVTASSPVPGGLQKFLAVGGGYVWLASSTSDRVLGFGTRSGRLLRRLPTGRTPKGVAYYGGVLWVANSGENTVTRIALRTDGHSILPAGAAPTGIVAGPGGVWVANRGDASVWRLDPDTGRRVGEPIGVGAGPISLALAPDAVWVAASDANELERIAPG